MHRPGYSAGTRLVHVSLRWPETPCGASSLLLHATRQPAAPAGRVSFATSQTGKTALATDPAGLTHRTGPIRVGSVLKRQTTDVTVARRRKVAAGRRQAGRIPTQIRAPQDPTTHPRWVVGVPAAPGAPQGREVGVGAVVWPRNGRMCLIHGTRALLRRLISQLPLCPHAIHGSWAANSIWPLVIENGTREVTNIGPVRTEPNQTQQSSSVTSA